MSVEFPCHKFQTCLLSETSSVSAAVGVTFRIRIGRRIRQTLDVPTMQRQCQAPTRQSACHELIWGESEPSQAGLPGLPTELFIYANKSLESVGNGRKFPSGLCRVRGFIVWVKHRVCHGGKWEFG